MDRRTYNLDIVSFIGQSESSLHWVRPFFSFIGGGSGLYFVLCEAFFVECRLWSR